MSESTRIFSADLLLSQAIEAAEAEGRVELVRDLLKAKQYEDWRHYNARIIEMSETD